MIVRRFRVGLISLLVGVLYPSGLLLPDETKSVAELKKEAKEMFTKGKFKESSAIWKGLIDQDPENALYYFNYAQTQFKREKWDEAEKGYRYVVKYRSSLAPVARLQIAKTYVKNDRETEAINLFKDILHSNTFPSIKGEAQRELEKIDPKEREKRERERQRKLSAPIEFPIGLKFFKQGQYKLAIANLELASNTYDEPELFLLKGISYYKLGYDKLAKLDFDRVISKSDDPDLRKNADMLLGLMKKKQAAKEATKDSNWIFTIDNSVGFASNPMNFSQIDKKSKNAQYSLAIDLGRKLIKTKKWYWDLVYSGSLDEPFENSEDRFVEHAADSKLQFRVNRWSFSLTPSAQQQEFGGQPYVSKYGGKLLIQKYFKNNFRLGVEGKYTLNQTTNNDRSYLGGRGQYQKLLIGGRGRRFDISFSAAFSKDRLNDDQDTLLSNNGDGYTVSLYIFPKPAITLSCTVNYLEKRYLPASATKFKRVDKNTSISFGVSYNFTPKVSAYFNSNITFIESNLNSSLQIEQTSVTEDLFDFRENVSIGLTWDLF